jgi:hypothetical protein
MQEREGGENRERGRREKAKESACRRGRGGKRRGRYHAIGDENVSDVFRQGMSKLMLQSGT